ncbi:hypothetical protein HDU92_000728 [Lobulomyces angularis]|nr:hypothetical protein HDU92_000728 [Lobulomyces angularis]
MNLPQMIFCSITLFLTTITTIFRYKRIYLMNIKTKISLEIILIHLGKYIPFSLMSTTIVLELINLAAELNEHQKFGETKFMLLQEISIMANLLASLFCLFCEIYFQFKMLKENLDDSNNRSNTLVCCNKNFLAKLRRYEMYRLKLKTIMLLLLLFDFTGIVLAVCINFLGVSLPVIATDCILNALIVMRT